MATRSVMKRIGIALGAIGLGLGTGACAGGYGYGGGGLGYGYADGYGYDGYGYDGYGFAGAGYAPGYFGWYNNFYYPGTGVYVYDRDRRPFRWNDTQRRYWEGRRGAGANYPGGRAEYRRDRPALRDNWTAFRQERRGDARAFRQDRRDDRQALNAGTITRDQFRAERQGDRRAYRTDLRQDRREFRQGQRAIIRDRSGVNPGRAAIRQQRQAARAAGRNFLGGGRRQR